MRAPQRFVSKMKFLITFLCIEIFFVRPLYAQATATGPTVDADNWILHALYAIDEILAVSLAASLAGLAIASATFASATKAAITEQAEKKFAKNIEVLKASAIEDLPSDVQAKFLTARVDSQKTSDEMEKTANGMQKYLVVSFFIFVLALGIIFVGDTFIGKYMKYSGIIFLIIEDLAAGVTMALGIWFLGLGARKILALNVPPVDRVSLINDFLLKLKNSTENNK